MRQKPYSEQFKREAVQRLESSSRTIGEVARDLGVSGSALKQWRKTSRRALALEVGAAQTHAAELVSLLREVSAAQQATIAAQAETIRLLRERLGHQPASATACQ